MQKNKLRLSWRNWLDILMEYGLYWLFLIYILMTVFRIAANYEWWGAVTGLITGVIYGAFIFRTLTLRSINMSGSNSMREEEWRDIPDFPNYQVSDEWRIMNKERGTIKATIQDGTLTVKLSKDGQVYHRGVRGLFLAAFPEKKD